MDYKKFVEDTELLSEIAAKYYSVEADQKRHRKEYFEKLSMVKVNG
jgi:hypothetical protein